MDLVGEFVRKSGCEMLCFTVGAVALAYALLMQNLESVFKFRRTTVRTSLQTYE